MAVTKIISASSALMPGKPMKHRRRHFLHQAAGIAALALLPKVAGAQGYPSRIVRFVVPFPPGGAADPIARVFANRMSEVWGQQLVIDNRGGAGGNIGAQAAATAAPDGYTLLIASGFLARNPFLYQSSPYDPLKDLAPVTKICDFTNIMIVPNSSPAKTVKEFIAYAKANPGKITFASSGTGAEPHMSGELFRALAGIEMTHVPYRGGGPALNDVIPGRIDVYFGTMPSTLSLVRSGQVRGLAVTSAKRSPFAPELPTIAEAALPGYDVTAWYGLFVPAKTPPAIITKIHDDAVAAIAYPQVKQRLAEIAAIAESSAPAELEALIKSEMALWGPIIRNANIRGE
jgi:tripartite-type tricarboxylate transporter receptor subunit TctC